MGVMNEQLHTTIDSPLGDLLLVGDGAALIGVYIQDGERPAAARGTAKSDALLGEARRQLDEYFAGERVEFDLPLAPSGTEFQRRVWRALEEIPYGDTISYGELARRIGRPTASRAVGMANGHNPISIVVPCHRVIGAAGALTGYAGGVERKRFLLDLERRAE